MSDLVGNPEDRFSHNEAHLTSDYLDDTLHCKNVVWTYLLTTNEAKKLWCKDVEKMFYDPDRDQCCKGKLFATFNNSLCLMNRMLAT